jgi:hypothetical protein
MTGELADVTNVPAVLLEKMLQASSAAKPQQNGSLGPVPVGARNNMLTSLAGKLRRVGCSAEELQAALSALNSRCDPPLPAAEVSKIATSVTRYTPAVGADLPPLAAVNFADIRPHLSDAYVVKNMLARDSLAAIIGASSSGKTFLAGDLAVHIARGESWRGHRVHGGLVVYVALEGLRSAENRFYAMRDALKLGNLPLVLSGGPMNLREPESVAAVLALVRTAERQFAMPCVAIFIDTLSRAMAGGDENAAQDMAALVAGADALRLATGALITLVHHLGKDETRGARGHSLLRAAIDTGLTVTAQGDVHVVVTSKQRDYAPGSPWAFKLTQVSVGTDNDGDAVTTCLLSQESRLPLPELAGKNQIALDAALREWRREHLGPESIPEAELVKVALQQGIDRRRRAEVLPAFIKAGRLIVIDGGFRFG